MLGDAQLLLGAFLLSLGVSSIAGAVLLGVYSRACRGLRAGALAAIGTVALVAMPLAVGMPTASGLWGDLLWPLLVMGAAAAAGTGAGLGLLYVLVEGR